VPWTSLIGVECLHLPGVITQVLTMQDGSVKQYIKWQNEPPHQRAASSEPQA
jgi:hypothetical protein